MKFSYPTVAALLIHATGCSGIDSLRPRNLYQADVSIVNNTDFTLTTKLQIEPTASVDGCEPDVKYLEAKIPAKETAELSTRMRCQHDPRGVIRVNGGGVLKDRKDAFIRIKGIVPSHYILAS